MARSRERGAGGGKDAAALREREAHFRALVESSTDHVFLLDRRGRYLLSNERVRERGLENAARLIGRRIQDVYPPAIASEYRRHFLRVLRTGKAVTFEHDLPLKSGLQHHLDTLFPVRERRRIVRVGGICRDITDRKQAEERVRTFSRELLAAREDEKKRVSSALHHDVGSLAVGLSAHFDAIKEDVRSGKIVKAIRWVNQARVLFKQAVGRLKGLAVELRPPDLDILGLCAALRHHFAQVTKRGGIRIHFTENLGKVHISEDAATILFRVAQEALTNAIQHGHARKVDIRLGTSKKAVHLAVRDNGRGFDPSGEGERGASRMGLRVMQEMAAFAGGALTVDSVRGKGTRVRVSLPLEAATGGRA